MGAGTSDRGGRRRIAIVGSGYGGGVMALRLAQAYGPEAAEVVVYERGSWREPGTFPATLGHGLRDLQISTPWARLGRRQALFDLHSGPDLSVLVGCGVGGTSLINAGVMLRPDAAVLADPRWPEALRRDRAGLDAAYGRAWEVLAPRTHPRAALLAKVDALAASAAALGGRAGLTPVAVTFGPARGYPAGACTDCGDCVTGCNHGAKHTVDRTYLAAAVAAGAQVRTGVDVDRLHREGGTWVLEATVDEAGRRRVRRRIEADLVVLAAGTLGSTGILLRTAQEGALRFSPRLGQGFSGNGDVLAFAFDADRPVNAMGDARDRGVPPGPCISAMVRSVGGGRDELLLQEGVVPTLLSRVVGWGLLAGAVLGRDRRAGAPLRWSAHLRALIGSPRRGPLHRTQTYLVMCTDDANGAVALGRRGRTVVDWRDVARRPVFRGVRATTDRAAGAIGAAGVPNPVASLGGWSSLLTVHPLGGCTMGPSVELGVVDDRGRVFDGTGDGLHPDLYVADGSVVPVPLDANPSLTIAALAERMAARLVEADGREPSPPMARTAAGVPVDRYELPDLPAAPLREAPPVSDLPVDQPGPRPAAPAPGGPGVVGVRLHESMRGWVGFGASEPEAGVRRGRADRSRMVTDLDVWWPDLAALRRDPATSAHLSGRVWVSDLPRPTLEVVSGTLSLFRPEPARPDTTTMAYDLDLRDVRGGRYRLELRKHLHDDGPLDAWRDTTVADARLEHQAGSGGHPPAPVAVGRLRIGPWAVLAMARSLEGTGPAAGARRAPARFVCFFLGQLVRIYGRVLAVPADLRRARRRAPARRLADGRPPYGERP